MMDYESALAYQTDSTRILSFKHNMFSQTSGQQPCVTRKSGNGRVTNELSHHGKSEHKANRKSA